MKIAILGATGQTGRRLLDVARARGWRAQVLVRDPAKLSDRSDLAVQVGDARSAADVRAVLSGVEAVFFCLGMADISRPATDLSDSLRTVIDAMQAHGPRRILAVAAAGALPHPAGGYRNQHGLPPHLQHISAEHVRNYEALRDSGLCWTLMCPVFLRADIPAGQGQYLFEDLPAGSRETGYADLALTMADLVNDPAAFERRVGIVSFR